jgi:ribosome-associated heat shock protein Hsp15
MSADHKGRDSHALRVDKWLWFTRFFKTRSLAAKAVSGGHVKLNGARVKPSHDLRVGDVLEIQRGMDLIECTVLAVAQRRGPPRDAQQCYDESEQSVARRAARAAERKAFASVYTQPTQGRPDKRTRRMLRSRFRETHDS